MNIIRVFYGLSLLFFFQSGNCQHKISGYINSEEKNKIIYLSLLQYNEENSINPSQIIKSVKTDSLGYFEFSGTILPEENNFYRVHTNINEGNSGFQLLTNKGQKNYYNFIFSNSDTLYFPKNKDIWFDNAQNTNSADIEWRRLVNYKISLHNEYIKIKNSEIYSSAKQKTVEKIKLYTYDSISSPLVKLFAFSYIKDDAKVLRADFENDSQFYFTLKEELNDYYNGKSYHLQFQEEISKLSYLQINEQLKSAKKLNYILITLVAILCSLLLFIFFKSKKILKNKIPYEHELTNLTIQERKIANLICQGQSNKDIASTLFISLNTVKSHISNLYSKMNVINRQELIRKIKNHT